MSSDFSDFTESAYRDVLAQAISRYSFEPFGTESAAPHVLWRHDVDFSVHRAAHPAKRLASQTGKPELSKRALPMAQPGADGDE